MPIYYTTEREKETMTSHRCTLTCATQARHVTLTLHTLKQSGLQLFAYKQLSAFVTGSCAITENQLCLVMHVQRKTHSALTDVSQHAQSSRTEQPQ